MKIPYVILLLERFPDSSLDGLYLFLYPAGFPFSVVDGYFCDRSLAGFHDGCMTFFDEFHNLVPFAFDNRPHRVDLIGKSACINNC